VCGRAKQGFPIDVKLTNPLVGSACHERTVHPSIRQLTEQDERLFIRVSTPFSLSCCDGSAVMVDSLENQNWAKVERARVTAVTDARWLGRLGWPSNARRVTSSHSRVPPCIHFLVVPAMLACLPPGLVSHRHGESKRSSPPSQNGHHHGAVVPGELHRQDIMGKRII
jgi:hypothetical protein